MVYDESKASVKRNSSTFHPELTDISSLVVDAKGRPSILSACLMALGERRSRQLAAAVTESTRTRGAS
jgi:hypothetical protein